MIDNQRDAKAGSGPHPSRRDFLRRVGMFAGGMALMGVPGIQPRLAAAADSRTFAGGSSALELDGQFIDVLKSAEGGFPKAEVFLEPPGPKSLIKKHVGPPKYQDIAIQFDPLMPKPLFDWIAGTLAMSPLRKNGAILTTDFNRVEQSRLQFNNALITEFDIPSCDATAREVGYLHLKFVPEFTAPLSGKGTVLPNVGAKKAWYRSNFRLSIPGLDCSRVSKIEALSFNQAVLPSPAGPKQKLEPAVPEYPNLIFYVPESFAGTFYAWFQDMVIKGNAGDTNEKSGTLEFLDPSLQGSYLTMNFHHLGIFGFTPEMSEATASTLKRVKVETYCEQMTLGPPK